MYINSKCFTNDYLYSRIKWDLEAIISFINNAKKILWINFFQYGLFKPFTDAIVRAKNRGVYVRMVINPRLFEDQQYVENFAKSNNIDYKWFGGFQNKDSYTDDHMKWMVSENGFYTGGNNMIPNYFTATGGICLTVLTTGPLRKNAQNWFEMWWTGSYSTGNPIKINNPMGSINNRFSNTTNWVNENTDLCDFTNYYYDRNTQNKPSYCVLEEDPVKDTCKGEIRENCNYTDGKPCGGECRFPEACAAANPDCCFQIIDKDEGTGFCYTARDNKCKTLQCQENSTCNEQKEACECDECYLEVEDENQNKICEEKCLNSSECNEGNCVCNECFTGDRCDQNACKDNEKCKDGKNV